MLINQATNATGPPQAEALAELRKRPLIAEQNNFFYRAYQELESDRPQSETGISAIPFSSIRAYADEYDLEGELREEFFHVIRAVDNHQSKVIADLRRKKVK